MSTVFLGLMRRVRVPLRWNAGRCPAALAKRRDVSSFFPRAPGGRVSLPAFLFLLWAVTWALPGRGAEVVAEYRQAFSNGGQPGPWSFWVNAAGPQSTDHELASARAGGVTDPTCYRPLAWREGQWVGPGGVRLGRHEGHPGAGAVESGTTFGRYAICGFKVARAGYYSIAQSHLRLVAAGSDGIDVIVQAGRWRPVLRKFCRPGQAADFDTEIGYVPAGTVIYVAVGPGKTSRADDFAMDFNICRGSRRSLQAQIDTARAAGRTRVRLRPGRYYADRTLDIAGWDDFSIDAQGVALVMPYRVTAVSITSCRGGKLAGMTIDQDPLPLTQGVVLALAPDRRWADVRIDEFYPAPPNGRPAGNRNMAFDPRTLNQVHPAAGFNIQRFESRGGDDYRLVLGHPLASEIQVGDILSVQVGAGPAAFTVTDCERMDIDRVTLHSSAAFSFYEQGGSDNTYRHLAVTPGPAHLLASRPRLRSSGADGFHSRDARIGPKVSDCLFERTGDDGMAIDGPWGVVAGRSNGPEIMLAVRAADLVAAGTEVRLFRFHGRTQARATVLSAVARPGDVAAARAVVRRQFPAFHRWRDYRYVYAVKLGGLAAADVSPGDLVSFPGRNGGGFEFRNNTIRGGRSRGIIVKANGVIAGNRIEDVQKPGILVYSAFGHDSMEAQFVENLAIQGNVIEGCNFMHPVQDALRYCGGIVITADTARDGSQWGADGHRNIRIEDNVIRDLYRGVNVTISDASGVVLKDNRFINTHQHAGGGGAAYGCDNRAVIWIDHADRVTIEGCRVEGLGPWGDAHHLVSVTATAQHVSGQLLVARPGAGGSPAGISALAPSRGAH